MTLFLLNLNSMTQYKQDGFLGSLCFYMLHLFAAHTNTITFAKKEVQNI